MIIPRRATAKSRTLSVKEGCASLRNKPEAPHTNNGIEKNREIKVIGLRRLSIRMRERVAQFRGSDDATPRIAPNNKTMLSKEQTTACCPLVK
jgi:hypothetical protein